MFAFVKKKQAVEAIDQVCAVAYKRISALKPQERSGALAVTNSLMIAGSKTFGANFAMKPMALDVEVAGNAVLELYGRRQEILNGADNLEQIEAENPIFLAFKRELTACEVALLTAGACFHPPAAKEAARCWRLLGSSTSFAKYAVEDLLIYQKTHSLNAVMTIDGKMPDAKQLYNLASVLLPLFRPKKAQGK